MRFICPCCKKIVDLVPDEPWKCKCQIIGPHFILPPSGFFTVMEAQPKWQDKEGRWHKVQRKPLMKRKPMLRH